MDPGMPKLEHAMFEFHGFGRHTRRSAELPVFCLLACHATMKATVTLTSRGAVSLPAKLREADVRAAVTAAGTSGSLRGTAGTGRGE
jgi:hypothetical protein